MATSCSVGRMMSPIILLLEGVIVLHEYYHHHQSLSDLHRKYRNTKGEAIERGNPSSIQTFMSLEGRSFQATIDDPPKLLNFLVCLLPGWSFKATKGPVFIRLHRNPRRKERQYSGGAVQCIAGGYLGGFRCCVRGVGYSIMFRNALLVSLLRPINYQLGRWKNSLGSRILLGRRVLDFLLHSRPTCGLSELITEFINMTWQP